jgi:tetratricopeptide (TPR) repeat protein
MRSALSLPAGALRASLALTLVLSGTAVPAASEIPAPSAAAALDYAFRFASAVPDDPKDETRAQESVVREALLLGATSQAKELASGIQGWRGGSAYADVAAALAREGKTEEASELVSLAEGIAAATRDWHGLRVQAHVAGALAILGDLDRASRLCAEVETRDPLYGGRATATLATAHAWRGDFDTALEILSGLDEKKDIYDTWWRTRGYIDLSRAEPLGKKQRLAALDRARQSAEGVAGWKRTEMLQQVAEAYLDLGKPGKAREALDRAESLILAEPDVTAAKASLLALMAATRAELGDDARARELLGPAETAASTSLDIERPRLLADVAGGYQLLGDESEAARIWAQALEDGESLANARPRALALSAVCRALARSGALLDTDRREKLEALLTTFPER